MQLHTCTNTRIHAYAHTSIHYNRKCMLEMHAHTITYINRPKHAHTYTQTCIYVGVYAYK